MSRGIPRPGNLNQGEVLMANQGLATWQATAAPVGGRAYSMSELVN